MINTMRLLKIRTNVLEVVVTLSFFTVYYIIVVNYGQLKPLKPQKIVKVEYGAHLRDVYHVQMGTMVEIDFHLIKL